MMAAIYLAWQSLKPSKQRLKLSLDKFCQIAKVNKHKCAMKRIAELKEVLCKLGKEIPWVKDKVTPDNVVQQMEDILKHRYALMRRALRTHDDALLAECRAGCEEETAPSHSSRVVEQSQNTSFVQQCRTNTERSQQPADENDCDREENWGKRVLFAPPCVIHSKKSRVEQPELRDVTGDEEISDSEIDSYIRTPREARDFALAQKILSLSESDKS